MAKDKVIPSNLVLCNEKFKYDNVEQMVNDTGLQLDNVVELLGYYQAGDGAGHKRIISDEDDGSGVQLGNGLWANIIHNGEVNVSWFGAKGDGSELLNKAISVADYINIDFDITLSNKIVIDKNADLNFMGKTLTIDITTLKSIYEIPNSLDYAIQVIGDSDFIIIRNVKVKYTNNIPIWSGIHRTVGVEDISGIVKLVKFENVNIYGGMSPDTCEGSVFCNVKSANQVIVDNLRFDGAEIPTKFTKTYRVLFNCEAKETTNYPLNVEYKNIIIKNAKNGDGNGLLRIASSLNANIHNVVSENSDKVIWVRNYDYGIGENKDDVISGINITGCNISDYTNWAIMIDAVTTRDFKKIPTLIQGNIFNNKTESLETIKMQPCHNITIKDNTFRKTSKAISFRTFSPSEDLPRGQDKSFKNITISNNKFIECGNVTVIKANYEVENIVIKNNDTSEHKIGTVHYVLWGVQHLLFVDNIIGKTDVVYDRAVDLGSANFSKDIVVKGNVISGNYTNKPIRYISQALVYQNNQYIYDNIVDNCYFNSTKELFDFPIARPYKFNNKKWTIKSKPLNKEVLKNGDIYILETENNGVFGYYFNGVEIIDFIKNTISQLDTPAMQYAMELEGVKQDYLEYSLEKFKYDKQLEAEEQARYEAYKNELMYNSELTWEEFLMSYPTTITSLQEPVIPETVQAFMDKYLGVKATQVKVDNSNAETLEINDDATALRTYFEKW